MRAGSRGCGMPDLKRLGSLIGQRFYPFTPGEPTRTTAPSCPHPDGVAPPAGSKGNKSRAWSRTSTKRSRTQVCSSFSSTSAVTERLLLRVQGRVDARMAGRMAVLRGGDLNGPASPRQRWSGPQHNTQ